MSVLIEDTKVSSSLNFHKVTSSTPTYQYRNVYPANGGSSTVTLTSGGETQNTIFKIPTEVVNLGESYLQYTLNTVAQGASTAAWLFKDTFGEFDSVLYRDTGTMNIVDLKFANLYNHVANRLNMNKNELAYHDELNGLVVTNAASGVANTRFDNTQCGLAYVEPRHLENTAINGTFAEPRKVYLKELCKDSFFGMAKDSLLPVETYLDINWIGNRIGFAVNSITDPNDVTKAALSGNITLTGLVLKLAVETNQDIVNELKEKVTSGLTLPIPWVKVHSTASTSSAPFTYSLPLDSKQHGKKIKRLIYVPFKSGASTNSLYDHTNVNGSKLGTYQTELNSQKLQRDVITVSATSNDDYMLHKKILNNTTYFNQPMYNFNWFHMDYFGNQEFNSDDGYILVDGYDLDKPVTWSINVFTGSASVLQNVAIVVGQKLLSITKTGFSVS